MKAENILTRAKAKDNMFNIIININNNININIMHILWMKKWKKKELQYYLIGKISLN